MPTISADRVLDLWERGHGATPSERALDELREWGFDASDAPVAQRDKALLGLYARVFGPTLDGVTACPQCGADLDVTVPADLLEATSDAVDEPIEVVHGELVIRVRPPSAGALAALEPSVDVLDAGRQLLARCVVSARRDGEAVDVEDVPDEVWDVVDLALATDGSAEPGLALTCEGCGATWSMVLDPVPFVTAAVDRAAADIAAMVHVLAAGYGWSERDILAMSATRRLLYAGVLEASA